MKDWSLEEIAAVVDNPKLGTDPDGEPMLRCGCPAHGGHDRNCSIKYGSDGKLLGYCHSHHCDFENIMAAVRGRLGEPEEPKMTVGSKRQESAQPDRVWELKDATGEVIARHVRSDTPRGKTVRWRLPDGTWGLSGTSTNDLPLYGAEIVSRAPVNVPVVLTEGEKAADALRAAGIMGVGTVTGASGTPCKGSLEVLRGRRVILWPDNDKGGFEHMGRVAEGLTDVASELLWYEWEDAPEKGDAADHPNLNITELEASPRWSRAPAIEGRMLIGRAILNSIDPPTELLPDVLLAGKTHNIFAPGGVGKTWVLVWIATELVKRGKSVVVFDLENGFRTYAERFEEMGGDPEQLDELLYYYPFPVFTPESYAKMLSEVRPDLVMFDSWIGFLAAEGRDENEAADISAWAESYSKPALRQGTAVVVLDHVPHEHDNRERGSRRKRDEVDVAWRLTKLRDFDRERIGLLAMSREKDREGWLPERLTFEIGVDVATGRFVMRRNDNLAPVHVTALSAREKRALEALESFENGARAGEWLDALREAGEDISRRALYRIRNSLIEKGKVVEEETDTTYSGGAHGRYVCTAPTAPIGDHGAPGEGRDGRSPLGGPSPSAPLPTTASPVPDDEEDGAPTSSAPDVGGFGATREERERKFEEMKRKLRRMREARERED